MESFESSDFVPFRAGIEAKAPFVLVSHNVVSCMDPDAPASLSPAVHEILREELGFTGLILTDDLVMDAVTDFTAARARPCRLSWPETICCSPPTAGTITRRSMTPWESGEVPMPR